IERYPGSAKYLINLSIDLRTRYERSAQPQDIDEALDLATQAVNATPPGHPLRAPRLRHLERARGLSQRRPSPARRLHDRRLRLVGDVNARVSRHMGIMYDFRAHLAAFGGEDPRAVLSAEAAAEAFELCTIPSDLAADDEV